jgi:predicted peptidase
VGQLADGSHLQTIKKQNMKKIPLLLSVFFSAVNVAKAQMSLYQKLYFIKEKDTLPYRLLLPENYDATKKYPLIFFLHGSGERGNDNEAQLVHGGKLFLKDSLRKNYPAIVIFPQCPANSFWSNVDIKKNKKEESDLKFQTGGKPTVAMGLLQQLVKNIIKNYPVQKKQIYVGGLSMGGMGTFEMVNRNPSLFAAAFPICGGADSAIASKIKRVNWWVFHGAKDDVVLPKYSQQIVDALQKINASVKFTLYPEANHNSWDSAFAEPGLMQWILSNKK